MILSDNEYIKQRKQNWTTTKSFSSAAKKKNCLQFRSKVENLKKAIKASSQSDLDNGVVTGMPASYQSQQYQQKATTTTKTKGYVDKGAMLRFGVKTVLKV